MQAVRKDSTDQETFTLQHAGSGWRMEVEVSVLTEKQLFGRAFGIHEADR